MNPTAIESSLKMILAQWMLIIAVAWLFGQLARRLRQPLAVGEILGGLLLGPSALGALWPEVFQNIFTPATQPTLQFIGKLGLILLLFQVGMEFDFGSLKPRTKVVTAVSFAGLIAPFLLGWLVGPWLHQNFAPNVPILGFKLFVCVALSITALPIMGRILLELKLERTPVGVLAISAAAIDDAAGWILLAAVTAIVTSGFDWQALLLQIGGLAALFALLLFVIGPLLRRWWRSMSTATGNPLPPTFLVGLLVALFASCIATNKLGVFSIFGAFLLGVALHQEHGLVKAWRDKFADFVLIAFVPVFFTNTGLRTEIGALNGSLAWFGCLVVTAVAVCGKLGGCFFGARLTGQPIREAASIAALMNTRALMGLVAINVGADLGLLPRELFTMFVIMALVTTAMTGPLLRWFLPPGYGDAAASQAMSDELAAMTPTGGR